MPFSSLMKDKISILKKSGEVFDDIQASVQTKKTFIHRSDILIETGDLIQRSMSNGTTQTYEVIDPGFHEGLSGIPAGYQIVHKNLGLPEADKAIQSITYNLNGANNRVNNNSVDNSTNIVNNNGDLFESVSALREEVMRLKLSDKETRDALEVVDAIDSQCQSDKPSKVVVGALVNSLPTFASIASIGSLIVSLLG
ncbi:hypothetical protein [Moritella yayanosii]|uniref:Uncharacterized protein n=1 Tax=Moritella yayanosii TaxID=69539 RepID=A0A330LUF0_9GAMM|nr:hypothetical protein [Moritella yayanosii]SQD77605.1 conserved protein of unknown function [Moritella yayanosii]